MIVYEDKNGILHIDGEGDVLIVDKTSEEFFEELVPFDIRERVQFDNFSVLARDCPQEAFEGRINVVHDLFYGKKPKTAKTRKSTTRRADGGAR